MLQSKDLNQRRRDRYHRDPEYRKMIIERERAKRAQDSFDCRVNLDKLDTFGRVRDYDFEGSGVRKTGMTFTAEEAANVLGRTPKSLYKYIKNEMFPRPPHVIKGMNDIKQGVYSEPQMHALMEVFGQHQAETPYYGAYHTATRDALFVRMQSIKED